MKSTSIQSKQLFIHRGDQVIVRAGDDRGKRGKVLAVKAGSGRVTIEGVNLITRHVKPSAKNTPVGRVQQPAPISAANVQLICPNCSKPTKRTVQLSGTTRTQVCRLCHESIAPVTSKDRV